jgi:hypothetical protein
VEIQAEELSSANTVIGDQLEAFPLIFGKRQVCPFQLLLLDIILDVLVNAIRQDRETKDCQGRNKTVFEDDMIIFVKNP